MQKTDQVRKRKIYGVRGLMEWHAVLMVGGHRVEIDFTGGTLTGYGVTPARYVTDDPVMQRLIEKSRHFKEGKIFIINAEVTSRNRDRRPRVAEALSWNRDRRTGVAEVDSQNRER